MLILQFRATPTPWRFHHAEDGLPAGMDVHVFYGNLLLAFAARAIHEH